MKILLLTAISLLIIVGCTDLDDSVVNQTHSNDSVVNQTNFETGIYGTITLRTGNCMPTVCMNDNCSSSCYNGPASGELYVFNSTILDNQTELIEIIQNFDVRKSITNASFTEQGFYNISVAPGSYVLFFKVYSNLVCGQGDCSIIAVNDSFVHFDEQINFATD